MHATAEEVPALAGARGPRSKAERGRERWDPTEAEIQDLGLAFALG
jgi:hypothetical protein